MIRLVEPWSARPATHYVRTELGHLAYQTFGSGERDIMFVAGGTSNIDAIWDEPSAVRFFDRLAGLGRVIMRDMRGSGVSDPVPETLWLPLEDNARDVIAVMDAVGSQQAVLYGDTEGGMTAIMVAATYPERVSALVLVNSLARLQRSDDYPIGMPPHVAASLSEQYVAQHGTTGAMLDLTAPSVAKDPRFREWFTRYQRLSEPMGLIQSTFEWFSRLDLRPALPLVRVPTLVVGRRDAMYHRLAYSEYLAAHIDGARLVVLDGADTLPFHVNDGRDVLDAVEDFLGGRSEPPASDRVLATILFTDIVRSTETASTLGDQQWLDLLSSHNRIVRAQLARYGGHEVKMTGDGLLATFAGPGRAVACAQAILTEAARVGLTLRAGLHTGEVELHDGDIAGLAVHIAARVMAFATDGGVVVSGTVKDLVAGSSMEFRACGTATLKGVPGEWSLFELVP